MRNKRYSDPSGSGLLLRRHLAGFYSAVDNQQPCLAISKCDREEISPPGNIATTITGHPQTIARIG